MTATLSHQAVLLEEAVDALVWRPDGIYIDGTFGRGGHSQAILKELNPQGRLIGFDKDPQAQAVAQEIKDSRFACIHNSFAAMRTELAQRGVSQVAGILLDLGVSSPQLDDPTRGFSFRLDGPLDMRMDSTRGETAAQWLATVSQEQLAQVIREYGEERFAGRIARVIIERRDQAEQLGPLTSTRELAEIVARVVKTHESQHPATRTFQAIRIHINQELADLSTTLEAALALLEQGGRLVVISFHSLEDRIVKRFMKAHASLEAFSDAASRNLPLREADLPSPPLKLLGRVRASVDEVQANPRARSAVMRIVQKVASAANGE